PITNYPLPITSLGDSISIQANTILTVNLETKIHNFVTSYSTFLCVYLCAPLRFNSNPYNRVSQKLKT
ncbi:hypothetical protein, partial [Fischerella thermalis]|uniref:hypothetical protein n=1 Tax=Fischerella thermalis TaxID=372787 RepID=UPI001CA47FF9